MKQGSQAHPDQHPATRGLFSTVLGHEQTSTTDIYLHADMETKKAALDKTRPPEVTPGTYTPAPGILTWLEAL